MTLWIFSGSLIGAMAIGMPIAFALIVCALALMWQMGNFDTQIIATNLVSGADNFPLMAVPFFLLAGELMNAGGMSRRIVNAAMAWVGHLRGGLGYVAVVASVLMASLSGAAVADTAAIAALLVPMMRTAGYDPARSTGLIAAGGIIAPVIPPSIGLVLFGVAGGVSISKLFMAGVFPGILLGVALAATWWWVARRDRVTVAAKMPMGERLRETARAFWAFLLPVIIVGGLKFGVFTPTEAAVVAVAYALVVGLFVYRQLHWRHIYGLMLNSAKTTAVIMFMVAAALVSAWLIALADIPGQVTQLMQPFMGSPTLLMFALMVLVVIVGTALDFAPTILILTPVLMPLVKQAGIDPVYFGVLFVINNAIGLITPPVGTVLNVASGVARVPMHDVIRGVMPFMIAQLVVLFLMVLFPQLVMVPLSLFR
ncbi:TRAP transporter large permease subunit [Ramlibacter ginsenosidimutans]|uniref:TRAP transporter large permease protein n=1 Tax=Ramlibacter ginsenosidimutans TaxID=502333 RepID=A0A934WNR4_9BURK|nr:TRAP transporter large permease subunit [Ramlibacter ginsenosidimutans]MBK6007956.1 TRAP transporter large permease subunit [Ramlibacter ginsenosidimutans]